MSKDIVPIGHIESKILLIRGRKVMLSTDLAQIYGVATKRLNEQVRRNRDRFPQDFMFQLTAAEKAEVVANCDHLALLKFSPSLPYAFTEHGAVMAASVLNSKRAVEVSVFVVRAFVRMSRMLASHRQLALKLAELESRVTGHDKNIQSLLAAIRSLITPPAPPRRKIGFATNPDDNIIAHDRLARQHRKR